MMFSRFRFWLIRRLAGRASITYNVAIYGYINLNPQYHMLWNTTFNPYPQQHDPLEILRPTE